MKILTDGVHLAAADLETLHAFAASINLPRRWFHAHHRHPHYDLLTPQSVERALAAGAQKVPSREIVLLLKTNFEGEDGLRWSEQHQTFPADQTEGPSMLIYAVSVSIDSEIAAEWAEWMRRVHIPDVLALGLFVSARMLRVSEPVVHGRDGWRFEYELVEPTKFERYQREHAPGLQADHTERYAGRFEASRTVSTLDQSWVA